MTAEPEESPLDFDIENKLAAPRFGRVNVIRGVKTIRQFLHVGLIEKSPDKALTDEIGRSVVNAFDWAESMRGDDDHS